jgi:hypothetical protein
VKFLSFIHKYSTYKKNISNKSSRCCEMHPLFYAFFLFLEIRFELRATYGL